MWWISKVWDTATGQEILTLKGHTGPVSSVTLSAEGQRIVSGSYDRTLKVWNAATVYHIAPGAIPDQGVVRRIHHSQNIPGGTASITQGITGDDRVPEGNSGACINGKAANRCRAAPLGNVKGNGGDPKLGFIDNNGGLTFTCRPLTGSPAIDAGNNDFAPGPFERPGRRRQ